jgi:hypothetical protein
MPGRYASFFSPDFSPRGTTAFFPRALGRKQLRLLRTPAIRRAGCARPYVGQRRIDGRRHPAPLLPSRDRSPAVRRTPEHLRARKNGDAGANGASRHMLPLLQTLAVRLPELSPETAPASLHVFFHALGRKVLRLLRRPRWCIDTVPGPPWWRAVETGSWTRSPVRETRAKVRDRAAAPLSHAGRSRWMPCRVGFAVALPFHPCTPRPMPTLGKAAARCPTRTIRTSVAATPSLAWRPRHPWGERGGHAIATIAQTRGRSGSRAMRHVCREWAPRQQPHGRGRPALARNAPAEVPGAAPQLLR